MPKHNLKAQAGPQSERADADKLHHHGCCMLPQILAQMRVPFVRPGAETTKVPSPLPGDPGAVDHSQGPGHDEGAGRLTMFHSAETLCFVSILFHAGLGSPRHVPTANQCEQGTQTHIVNGMLAACQAIAAHVQCWHLGMAV